MTTKDFTLEECTRLVALARKKQACEGNIEAAEAALDKGDIDELKAIARGNIEWLKEVRIPVTLEDLGDGPARSYYDNGQLAVECSYKDGERHGKYRSYYSNGQLWVECSYKDGERHGKYRSYYSNGKLEVECSYKDGKNRYD